jgi:hypothetical protein
MMANAQQAKNPIPIFKLAEFQIKSFTDKQNKLKLAAS